jgi:hypothetical protein
MLQFVPVRSRCYIHLSCYSYSVTFVQVVLAPCLADVAYKRLRNLGYGSFVLPDLQVRAFWSVQELFVVVFVCIKIIELLEGCSGRGFVQALCVTISVQAAEEPRL